MFVHNRFSQAYVFTEQNFEFGTDDVIDPAQGPLTMKTRVLAACEAMIPLVDTDRAQVLQTVIDTIEESNELILAVKQEIDEAWAEARRYLEAHPKVDKKGAEPATDKQKRWLHDLGCPVVPKTKSEATKLIDQYKTKTKGLFAKRRTPVS